MLFFLKKFVAQFFMPLPFVCCCFLLGWFLHRLTRFRKTGIAFKYLSLILFIFYGCGGLHPWLYNIERAYPPFDPTPQDCASLTGAPIVVLGQGIKKHSDLPVRCRERGLFVMRFLEGVRVARLIPESRLFISMGGDAPDAEKTVYLNSLLATAAFPTNRLTVISAARDTSDEAAMAEKAIARSFASSTNRPPLILVTSAAHIRRSVHIFKKRGFDSIIPSPCEYETFTPSVWTDYEVYRIPFPRQEYFDEAYRALYEWLGNVFEYLKP